MTYVQRFISIYPEVNVTCFRLQCIDVLLVFLLVVALASLLVRTCPKVVSVFEPNPFCISQMNRTIMVMQS